MLKIVLQIFNSLLSVRKGFCLIEILFFICTTTAHSQNLVTSFFNLSCPEKCWVITHLFSAKKAFEITKETRKTVDSLTRNKFLDNAPDGGQVDAFRHIYWMARLAQEIPIKSAISLGKKHEKANYNDFKKKKEQKIITHDKAACDMDLFNNKVGTELGKRNPSLPKDSLMTLIIAEILRGKALILKKDSTGNSLNTNGEILPKDSIMGIWETKRVLVPSN